MVSKALTGCIGRGKYIALVGKDARITERKLAAMDKIVMSRQI